MESFDDLFDPTDEGAFISMVRENLERGAATHRMISPEQYGQLARACWNKCQKDDVYALKLLIDPLVRPEFLAELPEKWANSRELFCELIAAIDSNGDLVNAPKDYAPPSDPDVLLAVIPAGSPSGGVVEDPTQQADYIIAFLDILGFKVLLREIGLTELTRRYEELLKTALFPESESRPWSLEIALVRGEPVPGLMFLPIQTSYFSDSLLLWVHYHPQHVAPFLDRCSKVFCKALALDMPIRGAVSVGNALMDKGRGIYLGFPLVEVAELEKKSNWVGVALGASWKSEILGVPIPPDRVFIYEPAIADGGSANFSGLVLDWPRVWRESRDDSPLDKLKDLCLPGLSTRVKKKYVEAIRFVEHSERNQDWFLPPGAQRLTVRDLRK